MDGECWQFLDAKLLDGAVRYNLLWHGGRERPPGELTIEAMADDVAAHLDEPADIVGVSMGGAVAQNIGFRHPDLVRSLVLAASAPGGGDGAGPRERARAVEELGMAGVLDNLIARWFTEEAIAVEGHPGIE